MNSKLEIEIFFRSSNPSQRKRRLFIPCLPKATEGILTILGCEFERRIEQKITLKSRLSDQSYFS